MAHRALMGRSPVFNGVIGLPGIENACPPQVLWVGDSRPTRSGSWSVAAVAINTFSVDHETVTGYLVRYRPRLRPRVTQNAIELFFGGPMPTNRLQYRVRKNRIGVGPISNQNPRDLRRQRCLHRKRERRRVKRLRQKRGQKRTGKRTVLPALLDYVFRHTGGYIPRSSGEKYHLRCPRNFSFIDKPQDTLRAFTSFTSACVASGIKSIYVNQQHCDFIDHCAESVLTAMALEAKRSQITFSGHFPDDPQQREIVLATGMAGTLGVPLPQPSGFLSFPLFRGQGGPQEARVSSLGEVTSTKFTDYINRCLARYGFELSREARRYLSTLVAEVIGNAEDHGGQRNWWIAGYLRQRTDQEYGDCHVTVFNIGETIASSLQKLPLGVPLRRRIERLVSQQKRRQLFGRGWTEEGLWTLYAMQEGVSRYNIEAEMGHRGQGTAQLIEFFQELGQSGVAKTSPKMCLVSGNTHILFTRKYTIKDQKVGKESRRIIAFNKKNDLKDRPDPKYVRHLNMRFPGTLISLRFYLDEEHLLKLHKGGNRGD